MIKSKELTLVAISKLVQHDMNPNKHSNKQIQEFIKQFEYQGFINPLIISNRSGKIVSGNGRYQALKKWGKITEVPCIFVDFESEEQEYLYLVADNGLHNQSEQDYNVIKVHLADLGIDAVKFDLMALPDFKLESVSTHDRLSGQESKHCESCGQKIK